MKNYSQDLKIRIVNYYLSQTVTYREMEKLFSIGRSTICRWVNVKDMKTNEQKSPCLGDRLSYQIKNLLLAEPYLYLREIRDKIGRKLSLVQISRIVRKMGFTIKKVVKRVVTSKNTQVIKDEFKDGMKKENWGSVYCLDETGFQLEMKSDYGRSLKGVRLYQDGKGKHIRKYWTGIFLISIKGVVKYELYKGSVNGEQLLNFLKDTLNNGGVLVMDNVSFHKSGKIKDYLKASSIDVKYTIPYSPELNPIEEVFGILKRKIRDLMSRGENEVKEAIKKGVLEINRRLDLKKFYIHSWS